MIVCYQFKIFDVGDKFPPVIHFARNIDEVFKNFAFGRNGGCVAICGWKIKTTKHK